MRLTVLGGGGFRVPLMYRALAGRAELGIDEVVLYDTDSSRLAAIAAVLRATPGPTVTTVTDAARALDGADVVFAAIRVGGSGGRIADERRALDHGVLGQETVGAGGLAFGLRTLPVMLDLAEAAARYAPGAWFLSFTNPAGMVTEAVRTVLGDRAVGICDSPVGLVRRAVGAARRHGLAPDDPAAPIEVDYVGINHLGWLRALRVAGQDVLPALLSDDVALHSFEEGRLFGPDLLRALGCLPNEYLAFYYDHLDLTAHLRTAATRGEVVAGQQDAFFAAASEDPAGAARWWEDARLRREQSYLAETRGSAEPRDEADLSGGGYEHVALDLIQALHTGSATRLILDVPNGVALPQLPPDMVVELPCTVDAAGFRADPVGPLDLHQLGLIASVRAAERAVIDAIRTGSRTVALRAFAIHPLVGSPRIATELLADVLGSTPDLAARLR